MPPTEPSLVFNSCFPRSLPLSYKGKGTQVALTILRYSAAFRFGVSPDIWRLKVSLRPKKRITFGSL
jgi:hypothetical protein